MNPADDLCYLPATELATAYRAGHLSPVAVIDAVLDRLERINPRLNAFTVVLAESARLAARRAAADFQAGRDPGPLAGIPFTVKDVTPTRGIKTMKGSKAFANYVPREDGLPVTRMLAAGGIFLGKTTTPEFGDKGITESPLTGTTNNPWRVTHTAGGSSGGAAAAVAAGLGPLADGSDGAGSIRIPASCCGVVGFKPSFGRVPVYPLVSAFDTIVHQGPIARTVADAALMLTVIAGPDDRDPFSIAESGVDYGKALDGASVRGVRIAYSPDLGLGPVDPVVRSITEAAAFEVFAQRLGAQVTTARPELADARAAMMTIWATANGTLATDYVLPRVERADIDPFLLELAERGAQLSAFDYERAAGPLRHRVYHRVREFLTEYDLLITPTITTPPFPHPGWVPGPAEVAGQPIDPLLGWVLTYPFNLTGHPAISIPAGWTAAGLPIGLQIVGPRHADRAVLQAAAAFERVAPWADRRPPIG